MNIYIIYCMNAYGMQGFIGLEGLGMYTGFCMSYSLNSSVSPLITPLVAPCIIPYIILSRSLDYSSHGYVEFGFYALRCGASGFGGVAR